MIYNYVNHFNKMKISQSKFLILMSTVVFYDDINCYDIYKMGERKVNYK